MRSDRVPLPTASSSMRIAAGVTVIKVTGAVDLANAKDFNTQLMWQVRAGERTVVLDLSEMTFLGLAGLDALIGAQAAACFTGRRVLMVAGTLCVNRVLEVTGLSSALNPYPTLAAALADVGKPKLELVR
ncbi:STAS domain-containing protein [Antrihabitans stalactiti]|nr:STAS domain-containing protein [Antrihabitans stalactiti]